MPAAKCASALTRCSIASLLNSSERSAASLCPGRPSDLAVAFSARGPVAQPDKTATRKTSAAAHPWAFRFMANQAQKAQSRRSGTDANTLLPLLGGEGNLLLPGAFLVAVQTQLLAPFVFVDFGFPTFFQ